MYDIIKTDDFKIAVEAEISLLDPICEIINICQGKSTNLSKGAELWMDLVIPRHIPTELKDCYRWRKAMALNDLSLATFYLDPFTDNQKMTQNQKSQVISFLSSKLSSVNRTELYDFDEQREPILTYKAETENAVDFWTFYGTTAPHLSEIALKLFKIPASTAQLERVFSMWQRIHSKIRNKLSFDTSKMLMSLYIHLNTTENSL